MKRSYFFIVFSLFALTACSGGAGSDSHTPVSVSMKIPSASSVSAVEKPVSEGVASIEARVLNSAGSSAAGSEKRDVAPNDEVVIDFEVPLGQMTFIVEAFSEKNSQGTLLFRGEKTENIVSGNTPSIVIEMQAVGGILPQNPAVVKGESLQFSMSGIDPSQVGWRLKSTPSRLENSIGTLDETTGFYQAPLAIPYDFSATRPIGLPVMIDVEAFDISSSKILDVVSLKILSDGKFDFNLRNQITPPGTGSGSTRSLSAGQRNIVYYQGNAYAVWEQGGKILFSETVLASNGTPSWADPLVLPGVGFTQKSAAIAVDLKGNLYVAFISGCFRTGCDSSFQKVVLLVRKVVDGVPEADFTQISLGDANDDTGPLSQNPTLAVSPDGAIVFVAWSAEPGDGGNDILLQRVNPVDGTKIDEDPKLIISTAESDEQPTMGVAKDGNVFLAWIEVDRNGSSAPNSNAVMVAVSLNGGGRFEQPVQVNEPPTDFRTIDRRPSLVPGEAGVVHIVWEKDVVGDSIFLATYNKGVLGTDGLKFGEDQQFPRFFDLNRSYNHLNPSIAWDGDKGVYIVLKEIVFDAVNEQFKHGIFLTKSADNGATFGPLQPVDDNLDDAQKTKFKDWPSIAVDETGRVFVVWTDQRGGVAPRYIWFAVSEFPLL
ncbi:hypothetical protein MNBD_NITROSPIRAE01-908 [hydrothermal vent metagenome]|uniref:Exo-alpha-sialidase n=1 Tax=hydrothermal vent metagenome TaxID=652676 RepID=A0A3B1CVZ5_9ZZZZ